MIVLLCEGEGDALAACTALQRRAGVDLTDDVVVAAVPGTGMPAARVADELLAVGAGEAVLAFDGDDAGRRYTDAVLDELAAVGISASVFDLPEGMDLADWLAHRRNPSLFAVALMMAGTLT